MFRRQVQSEKVAAADGHILLEVEAPTLRGDECHTLRASRSPLGCWDTSSAVAMSGADAPLWRVSLRIAAAGAGTSSSWDCATGELLLRKMAVTAACLLRETKAAVVVAGCACATDGRVGAGRVSPCRFSLRSEARLGRGRVPRYRRSVEWRLRRRVCR